MCSDHSSHIYEGLDLNVVAFSLGFSSGASMGSCAAPAVLEAPMQRQPRGKVGLLLLSHLSWHTHAVCTDALQASDGLPSLLLFENGNHAWELQRLR